MRTLPQYFLAIVPREPEKFRAHGRVRRRRGPLEEFLVGAPLSVPLSHLEQSPDEIMALVERYSGRRVMPW